ncbi:hypothetical protein [Tateyamaria sp.]|uniref:hypothetical protein n=1 Tax=Tateyamaria sp. TaxID=1929288 RepID=UPI003B21209E
MTRELNEIEFVQAMLRLPENARGQVYDDIKDRLKVDREYGAEQPHDPPGKVS